MKEKFEKYLGKQGFDPRGSRLILAISGGPDSVALGLLLKECGFSFALAHCNFKLRGEESDADQAFVQNLGEVWGVETQIRTFSTEDFAREKGLSIQMAARELRYDWFKELLDSGKADFVLLGQHMDDQAETILLNLVRGTGLRGLEGMKFRRDSFIRPLLFARKDEILEYLGQKRQEFRKDASNLDNKYRRNKIRNQIIPLLEELNPSMSENLALFSQRIGGAFEIYEKRILQEKERLLQEKEGCWELELSELLKLEAPEAYLFEFLRDFGFESDRVEEIREGILKGRVGNLYYSDNYELLLDRARLLIRKRNLKQDGPPELKQEIIDRREFSIKRDPKCACLDWEKVKFPLRVRKWRQGDAFHPLGMKQPKKLSNFFIDRKYSLFDKESAWLLCDKEDTILWVIGDRISEKHKIGSSTSKVLFVSLIENY